MELEVTKWEAEMKDSNTLRKFLYIHLAPEHLKGKMREILSLDMEILSVVVGIFLTQINNVLERHREMLITMLIDQVIGRVSLTIT